METIIPFVIAAVILLAFILAFYVFIKAGVKKLNASHQQFIKKQWKNITEEGFGNVHTAILDADKLLGYVLELRGYTGSVGEQLKKSGGLFGSIDRVWSAHKVRNQIAHEIGVNISDKEGKQVLNTFKKALNDLGAKL